VEQRRRISAYGLCRDDHDRLLLVRASGRSFHAGQWLFPGGGIDHGEHPADAVLREIAEETGLRAETVAVRDVVSDVVVMDDVDVILHQDRIIYDVTTNSGTLRDEDAGTTDAARWVPRTEIAEYRLMAFAAAVLGAAAEPQQPVAAEPQQPVAAEPQHPVAAEPQQPVAAPKSPLSRPPASTVEHDAPGGPRGQRFATYGLVTDPAERILLTRISPGYPGAGRWHLPGGGTDFGEQPAAALLRELVEESDQVGRVDGLLDVSHRHNPRALGPEGVPINWHTVRALYRVRVDLPTEPRVVESNGSTAEAAWFSRAEARRQRLTEIAASALADYGR
jgi:ADP-ribose pyrophosphatase YjhB (NUDIX family)